MPTSNKNTKLRIPLTFSNAYLLWTRCYHPHSKFGLHLETNTSGDHKKVILLDPSSTLFVSFLKPYLLKTSRFRFFISSSMQDAKKIIPIIKVIYLDISKIFGGYKFTHESLLPNNLRQGSLVTRPTRLNACW